MDELINITITAKSLNTIGQALQEIPYKFAAPALKELHEQVLIDQAKKKESAEKTKASPES